jgi:hypothetical protein
MSCTAIAFQLSDLWTGQRLGVGLVCLQARYVCVLRTGGDRIERHFSSPPQWREIQHEIAMGLSTDALPAASALVQVLAEGQRGIAVRWMSAQPVAFAEPAGAVAVLDAHLKAVAASLAAPRPAATSG